MWLERAAAVDAVDIQNWLFARTSVTAVVPAAIVPVTAWLFTGIEIAPDAAPAEDTVKSWPETVTFDPPGIPTLSARTAIELIVPLRDAVVAVKLGSSGGRSSLLTNPPLSVRPACHV